MTGGRLLGLTAGDGVVFDSMLVHRSTDNQSKQTRVSATAHFAAAGTIDRTRSTFGSSPFNDWMPWLRDGRFIAS